MLVRVRFYPNGGSQSETNDGADQGMVAVEGLLPHVRGTSARISSSRIRIGIGTPGSAPGKLRQRVGVRCVRVARTAVFGALRDTFVLCVSAVGRGDGIGTSATARSLRLRGLRYRARDQQQGNQHGENRFGVFHERSLLAARRAKLMGCGSSWSVLLRLGFLSVRLQPRSFKVI